MSSVYNDFNPSIPDGSLDGADTLQDMRNNAYALWTALAMGLLPGWSLACSGGTAAEPTQFLFSNGGTGRIKGVATWGTTFGAAGNIATIVWTVSQDSGSNYVAVGTTTNTYDTSGNLTGTTGVSGMVAFFAMLLGKVKAQLARIVAIETTLAGFGTIVSQDANAVDFSGGTVKGVVLGGTASGEAQRAYVNSVREKVVDLGSGTPANTFTIDFNAGGWFLCNVGANFTFAFTNFPENGFAQKVVIEVSGASGFTSTLPSGATWGSAGEPTWGAGPDLVSVAARGHASTPTKRFILSSFG